MEGKYIAEKMLESITMSSFAPIVAKMPVVTKDDLEKLLPDYVSGGDISKLFDTTTHVYISKDAMRKAHTKLALDVVVSHAENHLSNTKGMYEAIDVLKAYIDASEIK